MAELLNLMKNDNEMLDAYDAEMEEYTTKRDRHIGTTAFEALAVGLSELNINAALTDLDKETPYGDEGASTIDADWADD